MAAELLLLTAGRTGSAVPSPLPGLLFACLAAALAVAAAVPRWRRRIRWGRLGSGPPLSALGWITWMVALSAIAFSLFCQAGVFEAPAEVWAGAVLLAFMLVAAAGIHDSARYRNGSDGNSGGGAR